MIARGWQQNAEALFFLEGESIKEISSIIGVSTKSISKFLKGCPKYADEVERRKQSNQDRREYYKNYKRVSRANNISYAVTGDTLKAEHETAVQILSSEKYF